MRYEHPQKSHWGLRFGKRAEQSATMPAAMRDTATITAGMLDSHEHLTNQLVRTAPTSHATVQLNRDCRREDDVADKVENALW